MLARRGLKRLDRGIYARRATHLSREQSCVEDHEQRLSRDADVVRVDEILGHPSLNNRGPERWLDDKRILVDIRQRVADSRVIRECEVLVMRRVQDQT